MKNIFLSLALLLISLNVTAQVVSQKIGDNPTIISSSAVLEVESTNKGVLIPRVALTGSSDVATISSPATSLIIYNTATAGTAPNDVAPGFYFWNGTSWVRLATGNALLAEVDGVIGNEVTDAVANGGLTRLGSGTAADPYKLKINDGTVNGQILTWDGSKWVAQAVPAEVDGVIGNEVTDAVANGGLTRLGAGTAADPYKLKINDGSANGQLLTWDGSKWVAQAAPTEVDGVIGNEVTDAVANGGLTRLGAGTAADPYKLKINDGTVNGQILTWDGSKWVAQAIPAEVDGVIGNEVTDAVANGGLTRLGSGTAADPYKLKINDGTVNGQILTWDGSKWVAQAASSDWTITGNAGTDPTTNFIGTTDAQDFVFKANNSEVMRISNANGRLGIGTTTPSSSLHINGSFAMPLINVNSNVTLTASNAVVNVNTSAGDVTITLPAASTALNRIYSIIKSDSSTNKLIFSATINGNGFTFTQANIPGEYKLQSNGTNWILVN